MVSSPLRTVLALWLPLLVAGQLSSSTACSTDVDCSLAGACVSGKCHCEGWTKGADCAALNLVPLTSAALLAPAVLPVSNTTRWGSSPAFEGGVYHLFSAEMADHCTLGVRPDRCLEIDALRSMPSAAASALLRAPLTPRLLSRCGASRAR